MSIRTIREKGRITGFQALLGAGGPGCSAYFPVREFKGDTTKARAAAERYDRKMFGPKRIRAPRWERAGRTPIHMIERASAQEGMILHVTAAWYDARGRQKRTSASTRKHGMIGAIKVVRERVERDLGPLGLSDRIILNQARSDMRG